ncbi:hypothetical protein SADUNF_SadunfMtG0000100 (mitochondrion) [Salix dunnii]|uniref:F-ATPase protein 6 n=1 Tax=Salix dunnii TaxID=1413687 RepID=A0A835J0U9_9ROSI|nr:hypothetical protein SADUNF_SadunfMtG0000100 [Salix dunnii]
MLVFKHTLFGMAPGGLPDLNLPPEPLEEEPPRVLKTRELPLSREEILAIKNLQVFERQMRKKVFYMLKPLEFPVESPEDPDIRRVGGGTLVPNAWQSLVEFLYDFVLNPGMIPYSFTVTSHFLITLGDPGPLFIVLALTGLELGVAISQAHVSTISIFIAPVPEQKAEAELELEFFAPPPVPYQEASSEQKDNGLVYYKLLVDRAISDISSLVQSGSILNQRAGLSEGHSDTVFILFLLKSSRNGRIGEGLALECNHDVNLLMSGISLRKTNFSPIEMLSSFMDSMRDSVSVNCPD